MRGISWLAELLLAYQEEFYSMELVKFILYRKCLKQKHADPNRIYIGLFVWRINFWYGELEKCNKKSDLSLMCITDFHLETFLDMVYI